MAVLGKAGNVRFSSARRAAGGRYAELSIATQSGMQIERLQTFARHAVLQPGHFLGPDPGKSGPVCFQESPGKFEVHKDRNTRGARGRRAVSADDVCVVWPWSDLMRYPVAC